VPDRVIAATNGSNTVALFDGQNPDGSHWIYLETIGGGSGARATKDGLDGVQVHMTNTSNLPVEAFEIEYPLTLMRYELVDGSGGAGRFRGGMGLRRVYRADADCRLRVDGSRLRTRPWGLAGGLPGASAYFDFGGGQDNHGVIALEAGQIVEVVTAGGGGHGDPRQRDRAAVARDLAEGRYDARFAAEIYLYAPGEDGP
jgi:N-methylhydantoinase B